MTSKTPTWLRSVPIGFAIVTFAITAIVYYWLLELRGREVDFEQLPIFLNLFVSQDYWASLAALAVLLLAAAAPLQRLALDLERKMGEHRRTSAAMAFGLLVLGSRFAFRRSGSGRRIFRSSAIISCRSSASGTRSRYAASRRRSITC
jgi:hypothetical protein